MLVRSCMFSLCAVCGGQDNRPDKDDGDVDAVMMFYGKNRRDCCLLGKKKKTREHGGERHCATCGEFRTCYSSWKNVAVEYYCRLTHSAVKYYLRKISYDMIAPYQPTKKPQ